MQDEQTQTELLRQIRDALKKLVPQGKSPAAEAGKVADKVENGITARQAVDMGSGAQKKGFFGRTKEQLGTLGKAYIGYQAASQLAGSAGNIAASQMDPYTTSQRKGQDVRRAIVSNVPIVGGAINTVMDAANKQENTFEDYVLGGFADMEELAGAGVFIDEGARRARMGRLGREGIRRDMFKRQIAEDLSGFQDQFDESLDRGFDAGYRRLPMSQVRNFFRSTSEMVSGEADEAYRDMGQR